MNAFPFVMDHFYFSGDSQTPKPVRVDMVPGNEQLQLSITLSEEISPEDLAGILNKLWLEHFNKLRINPVTDCYINLLIKELVYDVALSLNEDGRISVDSLHAKGAV